MPSRSSPAKTLLVGLQPIAVAIAQILSFYAANTASFELAETARSLAIAGATAALAWAAVARVLRNARKASLLVSAAAVLFWSSSSLMAVLAPAGRDASPLSWAVMAILWLGALPFLAVRVARTDRNLRPAYTIVDLAALAGVVLPLALIALEEARSTPDSAPRAEAARVHAEGTIRPDVYLIVLDAQGRDDELAEHFDLEPGLGERLRDLGFFVARESRANYTTTLHAMPSLLNYEYVGDMKEEEIREHDLIVWVRNSRIVRFLRSRGYTFISYASGIGLTELARADVYSQPPHPVALGGVPIRVNHFERGLLAWTPLGPLVRRSALSPFSRHRARVLHALTDLPNHADDPRPTFVFAHVLAPHEPFVFGEHGEDVSRFESVFNLQRIYRDPDLPDEPGRVGPEYARRYRAQASFIADRVVDAVKQILERSEEPPIILIQGDHGPYGFTPDIREPRLAILNAYYLPLGGDAALYEGVSPVNSLRVVLNHYFGRALPLRPDRSFRATYTAPGSFTEIPHAHPPDETR